LNDNPLSAYKIKRYGVKRSTTTAPTRYRKPRYQSIQTIPKMKYRVKSVNNRSRKRMKN